MLITKSYVKSSRINFLIAWQIFVCNKFIWNHIWKKLERWKHYQYL